MQNATAYRLAKATEEIVSIADACLGGLRGRSALLVGPAKEQQPFSHLLQQAGMKYLYEEDTPLRLSAILPHVQLLISVPAPEPRLDGSEAKVWRALSLQEAVSIDALLSKWLLSTSEVYSALLALEMAEHIRQLPGKKYIRRL